jgi:CBS domain-containing protein
MAPAMRPSQITDSSDHFTGDHLDTPVRELMTPGVVMIVEDASLRTAYRALVAHGVHAVLVVGRSGGMPLGWVTARGLLGRVEERDSGLRRVCDAITERPETIAPSATAHEAIRALGRPGVTHLLVASRPDQLPEGVIGEMDLARLAAG